MFKYTSVKPHSEMPATDLDWGLQVNSNLSQREWPTDGEGQRVLELTAANLILAVSDLRTEVGRPIMPSPVAGAHVRQRTRRPGRHNGDRHSVDEIFPLSDAGDFFCRWEDAWLFLSAAEKHKDIHGIGIYTDMIFRGTAEGTYAMLHFDCRTLPEEVGFKELEWVGWRESVNNRMKYVYKQYDPVEYHRILGERGKKKT